MEGQVAEIQAPETTVLTETQENTSTIIDDISNSLDTTEDQTNETVTETTPTKEDVVETEEPTETEVEVESKEEDTEQKEDFDPEDLDFESEEENEENQYNVEGYDLQDYKDVLDFDNEESLEFIKGECKKLKDAGFTPEQAKLYIDSHISKYKEDAEEELKHNSKEYITEKLNTKLSKEEKRNYKPILNLMKEVSNQGAFPQEWIKDAMSNPNLVKILNGIYKHQTTTNNVVEVPKPVKKSFMTPDVAFDKYKDWITAQPSVTLQKTSDFVNSLKSSIREEDMDTFNAIFKNVMK